MVRPGFVGMRGQWSYTTDYGMQDYEYIWCAASRAAMKTFFLPANQGDTTPLPGIGSTDNHVTVRTFEIAAMLCIADK